MSQLRNLLTNKVIAHKFGTRKEFHRQRGYVALVSRLRSEITEQRSISKQRQPQASHKPQPKPGILRRVGNFLTRAFKGA